MAVGKGIKYHSADQIQGVDNAIGWDLSLKYITSGISTENRQLPQSSRSKWEADW